MRDKWNVEGVKGALWNWLLQEVFFLLWLGWCMKMQQLVATSDYACFFWLSFFLPYCCSMCRPWKKYCHHQWRRKCVFWIKSSSLWDNPNPQHLLTIQPDQLKNPRENKSHANPANGQKLVSNTTSRIKLVDCVLSWQRRTTAGRGVVDHVFITLMLGAQTQMWTVYMFYNVCRMKEFTIFNFIMQPCIG